MKGLRESLMLAEPELLLPSSDLTENPRGTPLPRGQQGVLEPRESGSPSAPWLMIRLRMARPRHQTIAQLPACPAPPLHRGPDGGARGRAEPSKPLSPSDQVTGISAHSSGQSHLRKPFSGAPPDLDAKCNATCKAGQCWKAEEPLPPPRVREKPEVSKGRERKERR